MQWKQQFMQWSNVTDRQIAVFTADQKEKVCLYSCSLFHKSESLEVCRGERDRGLDVLDGRQYP